MSGESDMVTVSDPKTEGEGRSKTTHYKVDVCIDTESTTTTSTSNNPNLTNSSVRRRYSDFQWLYKRLCFERPGAIVPIIPHRHAVTNAARFSEQLVEERRRHQEVFLRRVIIHPELANATCLSVFLRGDDATFETAKKETGGGGGSAEGGSTSEMETISIDRGGEEEGGEGSNNKPSPSASGGGKWKEKGRNFITKTAAKLSEATGGASGTELQKRPDDPQFEEAVEYVMSLDRQVAILSKEATALVAGVKTYSNGMHEVSEAFGALKVNHPASAGFAVFNVVLSSLSDATLSLHLSGKERADSELSAFDEPMQDLLRKVQAAKVAIKARKDRQITYTTRVNQIKSKRTTLDKIRGKPEKRDRVPQAESDLQIAEKSNDVARDELDAVTKRVLREMDRFKGDFADHVQRVMMDYAKLQIDFNRKVEDEWAKLVPHLEQTMGQPSNSPSEGGGDKDSGVPTIQFM